MRVLDENIIRGQRDLLRRWRVPFRQIGEELGRAGVQDAEIIPLLVQLKKPTFFTRDSWLAGTGRTVRYGEKNSAAFGSIGLKEIPGGERGTGERKQRLCPN